VIIRIFRAVPRTGQESAYERLIRVDSVDLVRAQPGLVALYAGHAIDDDAQGEIVMVSVWEDQAAMEADMKTPLVQALVADLGELTVHGIDFRIERSSPVAR